MNIDDINENITFIGEVVALTLQNVSIVNDLIERAKIDLTLIDNIAVCWPHRKNDLSFNDSLELNNILMKKFVKHFTLKNKLRGTALQKKTEKIDLSDENKITRIYKGKK